jgi:peroxiredoxin
MKNIFFPFAILFLFSCKHENKNGFEVNGVIRNAPDKIIYLQETPLGSGEQIVTDSSIIGNDGVFHLKGVAAEQSLFSLNLKSERYPFAFVINDASTITVNADLKNQNDYEVKGSAASQSLKDFSLTASGKWAGLYLLGRRMDSLKKSGSGDSVLMAVNAEGVAKLNELQEYVKEFIKNSSNPITSAWALGTYSQVFSLDDYQVLLNGVVTKFPGHKGIGTLKELNERQLALAKQKTQQDEGVPQWIGKQAPAFSLPDADGKEISLNSFKGKYVLVDFWASWCLPCRQENPNVVQAYNKYKNKNFTILGVSLDKEKDDWQNAIARDNLSWSQVSDLQEWNSIAVSTFNFNGIPFNVLIDPQGKIIAQSLRGAELESKLDELLK